MKIYILSIALQIMAVFVLFIEIFVPSLGVLTLGAITLFFYSLYLIYTNLSTTFGLVLTIIDITIIPLILIFGIKFLGNSPLSLKRRLFKNDGVVTQEKESERYINMKGIALTNLRPSGIAEINDQRLDVVTEAEYIDAGTNIVVTKTTGNRIIVKRERHSL